MNKIDVSSISSKSLRNKKYIDVFPEYYDLEKITENSLWHNNQNVFDHVLKVFNSLENILLFKDFNKIKKGILNKYFTRKIGRLTRKDVLVVATLLHDIAKIDTLVKRPDGTSYCPGHDLIAAGRVKMFSKRFGLNSNDEYYVERIVRYHGFISEILNLIISNKNNKIYMNILGDTVGDIEIELILLMQADLLGSDLKMNDKKGFNDRVKILSWMFNILLKSLN